MKKQYKEETAVYEDVRSTYINQGCPVCSVNHDYKLRGRSILCICGAVLRESPDKKNRLIRVG
jgi:hypothetical protein